MISDEGGDSVVGRVQDGQSAVIGLEDEVRGGHPGGRQALRGQLTAEELFEPHALPWPV